jgi:membrane protease YdiL (CAAX protease family)
MASEVRIANLAFMVFWPILVVSILLAGWRWPQMRAFADKMLAQWKPALAIALIALLSYALTGRGILNPYVVAVFCQGMIGLAIARDIAGFEPLAFTHSILRRDHPLRSIVLMIVFALLLGLAGIVLGAVGIGVIRQILGETYDVGRAAGENPLNLAQTFFYFLFGAGVAEETTYRLVFLSLLWRITGRKRLAILLAAILFAIYHLTPLDGMYRTFWQFPISQLVSSSLIGLLWGYAYVERGYETVVLAHTFSDWIPVLLFS